MVCISSEAWISRPEVPYLLTERNIKKLFRRCRWRLWWRWSSAPKFDGHRRFQTHPDQRCSDSVDSATSFSGCLSNAGSCMWLVTCYREMFHDFFLSIIMCGPYHLDIVDGFYFRFWQFYLQRGLQSFQIHTVVIVICLLIIFFPTTCWFAKMLSQLFQGGVILGAYNVLTYQEGCGLSHELDAVKKTCPKTALAACGSLKQIGSRLHYWQRLVWGQFVTSLQRLNSCNVFLNLQRWTH